MWSARCCGRHRFRRWLFKNWSQHHQSTVASSPCDTSNRAFVSADSSAAVWREIQIKTWVGSANKAKHSLMKFHMVSTKLWCVQWGGMQIAALVRSTRRSAALPGACKQTAREMISSLYSFGSWSGSFGATLLMAVCPTRKLIAFTRCKMIPPSNGWNENRRCCRSRRPPGLKASVFVTGNPAWQHQAEGKKRVWVEAREIRGWMRGEGRRLKSVHVSKGRRRKVGMWGEAVNAQQRRNNARRLAGVFHHFPSARCRLETNKVRRRQLWSSAALFHHPLTLKDLFKAYGEIKSFAPM